MKYALDAHRFVLLSDSSLTACYAIKNGVLHLRKESPNVAQKARAVIKCFGLEKSIVHQGRDYSGAYLAGRHSLEAMPQVKSPINELRDT